MTLRELLSGIADAIRQKEGSTGSIPATTFRERILAIMTGHDVSGVTATEGDVLDGVVFVNSAGEEKTGAIPKKETTVYVPATTSQKIAAGQYLAGAQIIAGDDNLLPENIVSGKSIFGVTGTGSSGGQVSYQTITDLTGDTEKITVTAEFVPKGILIMPGSSVNGSTDKVTAQNQVVMFFAHEDSYYACAGVVDTSADELTISRSTYRSVTGVTADPTYSVTISGNSISVSCVDSKYRFGAQHYTVVIFG